MRLKSFIRAAAAMAAIGLAALSARAGELTLDGASFFRPDGWEMTAQGSVHLLRRNFPETAGEGGAGRATIFILGPVADASARFDASFERLLTPLPELAGKGSTIAARMSCREAGFWFSTARAAMQPNS